MTPSERNYAQIEKETLAIVFACERFDHYLCGQEHITVQLHHKPPEIIFKKSLLSATKRLQRMLLQLQRYNLNVTNVPGKYLYIADFLTRAALPAKQTDANSLPYEVYQVHRSECCVTHIEEIDPGEFCNVSNTIFCKIQQATKEDATLQKLNT